MGCLYKNVASVRDVLGPLVLLLVALNHFYRVQFCSLTPWKGGGFGMFSSIDSHSSRSVRLLLLSSDNTSPLRVELPITREISTLHERARAEASPGNLDALALTLACLEFRLYGLAHDGADALQRDASNWASVRGERVRSKQHTKPDDRLLSEPLAYDRIRVEVSRVVFNGDTPSMTTEAMGAVTTDRRNPESAECRQEQRS
jgi:hypothetical protein